METSVAGHGQRIAGVETTVADHGAQIGLMQSTLTTLQSDVSGLKDRVGGLEQKTKDLSKGIAASMAMPALSIPSGKAFAFGMDLSTYDGMQEIGAAAAFKLDRTWSVNAGLGGSLQGGNVGARVGVRAAW